MLSIYKRELRSYFSGMFGYVYLTFYLLFANLFTAILCLYGRASSIELSYGYTAFVFLLSIPMLSLKGFADEKRQKTYLLLSSLPIKPSGLVLGKYLAMITLTGIGQLSGFLSVIVLSFYGQINLISTISGTIAFFLCGCALVAIGLFISSLSENLIVCTLTTFGGMLIIYFLPELVALLPTTAVGSFAVLSVLSLVIGLVAYIVTKSRVVLCMTVCLLEAVCTAIWAFADGFMEGLAVRIFSALSITKQLADFTTYGMLDLQGIVYFIAIICLFVYFTVISIRRQSQAEMRRGTIALTTAVLAVTLSVLTYLLIGLLPTSIKKLDLTSKKVTELSDIAKNYLDTMLTDDVEVMLVAVAGSEDPTLSDFLSRAAECNGHITVKTLDPAVHPAIVASYTDKELSDNSLIVRSSKRAKVVESYDMYRFTVYDEQNQVTLGEYAYSDFYTMLTNYSSYFSAGVYSYEQLFAAENTLISAVDFVTSDTLPTAYVLSGHGEYTLPDGVLSALSIDNVDVKSLSLGTLTAVPDDADCVIINVPSSDITEHEREMLSKYLSDDGNLMLISDHRTVKFEKLMKLLAEYELSASYGYVYEADADNYLSYDDFILANSSSANSYLGLGEYNAAFIDAHPIYFPQDSDTVSDDPISYVSLFSTSEGARLHMLAEGEDSSAASSAADDSVGCYNIGVLAARGSSHVMWFSSGYFLSPDVNSVAAGGNFIYFVALLEKLGGKQTSLSIASKAMVEDALVINSAQAIFWTLILVVCLPICLLAVGLIIVIKRRRRT